MKNRFFVLFFLAFGFVLASCRPSQKSVQMSNQINPIDLSDVIRDKADIEGFGMLEYELYNVPGNGSSDFQSFIRNYTQTLEEYEFDQSSSYWIEDNTGLSENVKKMMAKHNRNLSTTHYKYFDGSTSFVFNYLNSNGKYEIYSMEAHIRGDNNEYSVKDDYDQDIADYTEAIRLDPKSAEAYHYLGLVYFWKRDFDKAIVDLNEAIRLDSTSAWTYRSRGDVYYLKDNYDKAIVDYTEAIRLAPKRAEAYKKRAEAYDKKGDYEKAIADYKAALRINQNDNDIKKIIEEVQRKLRSTGN